MLVSSYEEKVACEKILEKMGLKGYLVSEAMLLAVMNVFSHQGITSNLSHK